MSDDEEMVAPGDVKAGTDSKPPKTNIIEKSVTAVVNISKLDTELDHAEFEWKCPAVSTYDDGKKVNNSEGTMVGGVSWRFMVFPGGNQTQGKHFGLFIELDPESIPADERLFERFIFFRLGIRSHDGKLHMTQGANHRFTKNATNWGFAKMLDMPKLREPANNFLVDDTVIVTAEIWQVDGGGLDWGLHSRYNSRKVTGCVGIQNQGATCYMNSILQAMFFTNQLRLGIFNMPTEKDSAEKNVALALQRVCYRLQTSADAIETKELTDSFGWDSLEAFMQHDVQEFSRVLMDNIEEKMKGTVVDGLVGKLLAGKMKSFIKCLNVDYESSRTEEFYDIQLNVKGMNTLEKAFEDYVSMETLDGDNQYRAEGHGLQDAEKGVIFQEFPRVMHLQLMRFEYDFLRDENYKNNDRFEFPEHIDLDRFLETPGSCPAKYTLHSVLIHSGNLHGGHYTVFVRPTPDKEWLKFNDEFVTPASFIEVCEEGFGKNPDERSIYRCSNAYMLVYMRDDTLSEVLKPIEIVDIPEHLQVRFKQEEEIADIKRQEKQDSFKKVMVDCLFASTLRENHGFDLCDFRDSKTFVREVLWREQTVGELIDVIAEKHKIEPKNLRLWAFSQRTNQTLRTRQPLEPSTKLDCIDFIVRQGARRSRVFVEELPSDPSLRARVEPCDNLEHIYFFIKFYDSHAAENPLSIVGNLSARKDATMDDYLEDLVAICGLPKDTPVIIYEEITRSDLQIAQRNIPLGKSEYESGDILVVQRRPSEAEKLQPLVLAEQYYTHITNQVSVVFKDIKNVNTVFHVMLDKTNSYEQVVQALAQQLEMTEPGDHFKLQLTAIELNRFDEEVMGMKIFSTAHTLEFMSRSGRARFKFYYEKLDYTVQELEKNVRLTRLSFFDRSTAKLEPLPEVLVPPRTPLHSVAKMCSAHMKNYKQDDHITAYAVQDCRIFDLLDSYTNANMLENRHIFFEISDDDRKGHLPRNRKIVSVSHIQKHAGHMHDVPFTFTLIDGELVADLRKRLQEFLHVDEKIFKKWKLALLMWHSNHLRYFADDDTIAVADFLEGSDYLAIDHIDKNARRYGIERAIKIYN